MNVTKKREKRKNATGLDALYFASGIQSEMIGVDSFAAALLPLNGTTLVRTCTDTLVLIWLPM